MSTNRSGTSTEFDIVTHIKFCARICRSTINRGRPVNWFKRIHPLPSPPALRRTTRSLHTMSEVQDPQPEIPQEPIQELLLPHRFSLWYTDFAAVNASNLAPKDRTFNSYPFPIPIEHMVVPQQILQQDIHPGANLPQIRFHRLKKQVIHTSPGSHTVIASSVQNFDNLGVQLHSVRVADELWPALVGFALGPTPVPQGQNGRFPGTYGDRFSTFRNGGPDLPTRAEQMRPITSLWGWFLTHLMTRRPLVNSELAVQDEIYRQLLYPMDLLIMVRTCIIYSCRLTQHSSRAGTQITVVTQTPLCLAGVVRWMAIAVRTKSDSEAGGSVFVTQCGPRFGITLL